MVKLRTPSLSSGMLVRRTQSRCFFGDSVPVSGFLSKTVPAGVHRPLDLSFSQPMASGTAPQSRRKWIRSEKSISAAGSRSSSSYCILYNFFPTMSVRQWKARQLPPLRKPLTLPSSTILNVLSALSSSPWCSSCPDCPSSVVRQ